MPNLELVPKQAAQLSDAEARTRALDTTQSFLVEAPAGSGKTALILQRYLKLLALVEEPSQVLAITFTKKATAELHHRVLSQLQLAAAQTPPKDPYEELTRTLAEAVLVHSATLGWALLDNPHRLHIRTIDSLALDIASGLPILSGSGGTQSPTTEPEPLYAEAAHRTLMQLGGSDPTFNAALETILLHRDGNLADAQRHIAAMLALRDQWGELIPIGTALDDRTLDEVVLPKLERAIALAICRGLTTLTRALPHGVLEELASLGLRIGSPHCTGNTPAEEAAELDHWNALLELLLTKSDTYRKTLSAKLLGVDELSPAHKAELTALIDRIRHDEALLDLFAEVRALPSATYDPDQWQLTKALFRVLSRALTELQLVFASRGQCDFAELGLLARAALRNDSALDDLRAASGMELQHLLVDEMQDTSTSQYELLHLLTGSWDGAGQTVFLVGDPKQSIYLFRQARVERFLETMHTGHLGPIGDSLPLTTLHLTANFRSQPALVASFNHDFTRIFPAHATAPEEVTYRPATAAREQGVPHDHEAAGGVIVGGIPRGPSLVPAPTQAQATTWHTALQPYNSDTETAANLRRRHRKRIAAEIRTLIQTIQSRPLPPGREKPWSIAILVRQRIHLPEIIAALKGKPAPGFSSNNSQTSPCPIHDGPIVMSGSTNTAKPCTCPIPFRANEIDLLSERPEILDLISLTRALLHPADRIAWLALLRTPLCGIGLSDLHILAGEDDANLKNRTILTLIEDRGDLLSHDGIQRLRLFYPIITEALARRGRQPLAQWVHQTWLAFAADLYATEEVRSNIARFLRLLDELEDPGGTLSLSRLQQRMVRLFASPAVRPAAVDLMTIHGAKGLEWDFVLVPGLERVGMNTNGRLFDWIETGSEEDEYTAPGIVAPIRGKGIALNKLNEWMRSLDKARNAAEVKRLYYVASTRAREELHLFATLEERASGERQPKSNTLLAAAWPAAEEHFATLQPIPASSPSVLAPTAGAPHSSQSRRDEWEVHSFTGDEAAAFASRYPEPLGSGNTTDDEEEGLQPLGYGFAMAASAANPQPIIQRIPAPPFSLTSPKVREAAIPTGISYARPQGNLIARTLGTITHALLEQLSSETPEDLSNWTPRITTLLRAAGLSPFEVQRQTPTILRALTQTLASETGQWLLAPHPRAASETALTSVSADEETQTIRLDRIFLAGPEPRTHGETHLWIVDYKTATHGHEGLEAWLDEQKALYRPQLDLYARQFTTHPLRLGLYYPLLDRLLWWSSGEPD